MSFYYVKDDGTATGDNGRYATKQTGSFAGLGVSGYYSDVETAFAATTPPAADDWIIISDAHAFVAAGAVTWVGVATGIPIRILCVSDTAIDAVRGGTRGKEQTGSGTNDDFGFTGNLYVEGMEFEAADNIQSGANGKVFRDCKFVIPGSGDLFRLFTDGAVKELYDCELALNNASAATQISGGASLEMYGGSVTTVSAGVTSLISGIASSGGAIAKFIGVDLSAVTGTLVASMGDNAEVDDGIVILFDRCKLASGVAFVAEAFNSFNQRVTVMRSSATSSDAEYQFFIKQFSGEVQDDDVIRRADDEPFTDSATDVSYKIVTNAQCSPGSPLWFDFPTVRWSALSAGATDTLRLFFASATSGLTKNDLYVELIYPDGTNKHTPNVILTSEFILDTGTTHTTDSGSDWRDGGSPLTSQTEYQLDVSTAGDVGTDSYPIVRVYVSKASTTINLASEFDLV